MSNWIWLSTPFWPPKNVDKIFYAKSILINNTVNVLSLSCTKFSFLMLYTVFWCYRLPVVQLLIYRISVHACVINLQLSWRGCCWLLDFYFCFFCFAFFCICCHIVLTNNVEYNLLLMFRQHLLPSSGWCSWLPFAARCRCGEQIVIDIRELIGPSVSVHRLVLFLF